MEHARHPGTCESRAFIIVDALSEGCLAWTRKALLHLGATLACTVKRPPPIGLAVIQRKGPRQSTQLQVLLRPGSSFQLREFHACIGRVTAADPSNAADGKTLGGAVKVLIEHMMKLPGGSSCHNHVFILSCNFTDHPLLQKVIQVQLTVDIFRLALVCCMQLHASLHFLQLHGPEANLEGLPDTLSGMQDQQQQQGGMHVDAALEQCINTCAPYASIDNLTADCEAVVTLLCQSWLRELLLQNSSSSRSSSRSSSSSLSAVDMLLQLGQQQALPCLLQQHLLQLDPWLLPAHLCPCHNIPMHPPASTSSFAAVAAAAMSSDSDFATAAGLLALPEEVPWRCGLTGQRVLQDVTTCNKDASILQLGRHTQLKAAPGFKYGGNSSCSNGNQCGEPLAALALPPGQPCVLSVKHVVGLHEIDSMMIYGMPLVAIPAISSGGGSSSNAAAAATAFAGQQGSIAGEGCSSDPSMLMRVVCQLLLEQQQVLLASSSHNIHQRCHTPLQQWYMLQPAADGCSLLLRCMASREQLLPPHGYHGVKQFEGPEDDGEVTLLDADQLEAVRSALAGLGLRSDEEQLHTEPAHAAAACAATAAAAEGVGMTGSIAACLATAPAGVMPVADTHAADGGGGAGAGEAAVVAAAADADGTAEGKDISAAIGVRPVAPAAEVAAAAQGLTDSYGSSFSHSRYMPLMLSCGLHDWVASVLENTTSTYIAPAMPAAAATGAGAGATIAGPPAPPQTAVAQQQQQRQQSCAAAMTGPGAVSVGPPTSQQGQQLLQPGPYQHTSHGHQLQQEVLGQPGVANRSRGGDQAGPGSSVVTRSGAAAATAATFVQNKGGRRASGGRGTAKNALKLSSSNTVPGR